MLDTCKKQETNFWQGGTAMLESFHTSALMAEDVASPSTTYDSRSGRLRDRLQSFPSTQILTAEKFLVCLLNSTPLLNLLS